jgi:glycosyltransferase involved in cell wall biosynthesis
VNKTGLGVSVVIPVYNEQDSIAVTIEAIDQVLQGTDITYEIIAVDDGSTDNTPQLLSELRSRYPHLVTCGHETNLGYGAALKAGISRSAFERVLIIDADQTYPVEKIPLLLQWAGEFDMVVGSRDGANVQIPWVRRPAKFFLNRLAQLLSGRRIPDLNSGFRVFRKEIARKFAHMLPDGFSFTSTLTLIALHEGYTLHYIPISYFKRNGKSKIKPLRDTLNFLELILKTILYVNPIRIFLPASLFFFALSLILFVIRVTLGPAFLVSILISFICGFELLVLGMLADLIDKRLR